MPITRLPIATRDIARVAELAQVCRAVVTRYRAGLPVHRSSQACIERAVGELPALAQLDIPCTHTVAVLSSALPMPVASIPDPPRYVPDANIPEVPACLLTLGQIASIPRAAPTDPRAPVGPGGGETAQIEPVHTEKPNDFALAAVVVAGPRPPRCTSKSRCHVTILDEFGEVVQP